MLPFALIVAGPTASGKSALALALAEQLDGTIINADAMQTYRELRVLTARPTREEEARVPHVLYGVRPVAEPGSAASWRQAALAQMETARAGGRLPILTGGSGLYFSALIDGIAEIPDIGAHARSEARKLLQEIGPAALHARLAALDAETAGRLRPTDSQRMARAWEVLIGTGTGLAAWQARSVRPARWRFASVLLDPPRQELRSAIGARFAAMLRCGAIQEVEDLLALKLDPDLPAMRAHGVPELAAYLRGEQPLDQAARRAELVTGQYTKRQATWFRHHRLGDPGTTHTIHARITIDEQFSQRIHPDTLAFIEAFA